MKVAEEFYALTDAHRIRWIALALLAFMPAQGNWAGFVLIPACYVLYAELRSIRTSRRMARDLHAYLVLS